MPKNFLVSGNYNKFISADLLFLVLTAICVISGLKSTYAVRVCIGSDLILKWINVRCTESRSVMALFSQLIGTWTVDITNVQHKCVTMQHYSLFFSDRDSII